MHRFLRQPLTWFLLIGALLFAADFFFAVERNEIVVSAEQRQRLAALWQTQTGLQASPQELDSLVENWIQEEVLYREALRLGLDQEDSIIRRRLVQKLNFIAESEPAGEPEEASLQAFYETHRADYTLPVRYSFRQLYFPDLEQAEAAVGAIAGGANPETLGTSSMLSSDYAYRSALNLDASFGFGFAGHLDELQPGGEQWQGPVRSGMGFHLIQLRAVHPEEITPYAAIREQVLEDYQQDQKELARQQYLQRLLEEYQISVEVP